MNIKAFIFDLDGVLVDTAQYHYLAWLEIANSLSLHFDHGLNEKLKGVSRSHSLEIIFQRNQRDIRDCDIEAVLNRKNQIYLSYIEQIDSHELLPGAMEVLKSARSRSLKVCLGSASKNAKLILNKTGIYDLFDLIVDGNEVSKAKPDPEVFQRSCEHFGLIGPQCLVFEDSLAGITAAKTANMKTVGIGEKTILTTADTVIQNLSFFDFNHFQ